MSGMTVNDDTFPVILMNSATLSKDGDRCHRNWGLPAIEELSRSGRILVIPKLIERLFQKIGLVQSFVGFQKHFQSFLAFHIQIGFVGQ
jgi:hypothetical protein